MNLYVIKSGTVTRNSDILKALKTHGQEAQKRLLQTDKRAIVRVYYIVTAGQKSSTFHDGVHRPSSAEFWAQTFAIDDEKQAIDLALAMAQEAGTLLSRFANEDALRALETAVAAFIASADDPTAVDWEFLAERNMIGSDEVRADSKLRHARAQQAAKIAGYHWPVKKRVKDDSSEQAASLAELAASLTVEAEEELSAVLPPEDQ